MVMDYNAGSLSLSSDEGLLDGSVDIGNGAALLKANKMYKWALIDNANKKRPARILNLCDWASLQVFLLVL